MSDMAWLRGLLGSEEEEEQPAQLLKVSARSQPGIVAGAIAGVIREGKVAEVQAIGPRAVNQAINSVAVARNYLVADDIDVICIPVFVELTIGDLERTGIKLTVEPR